VSVELTPPRSPELAKVIDAARQMRALSVDAINIPDGPRASARVSPLATAVRIEREAGIETVLHYCCRDRNMLGMQSDLLGAAALGLRNLLLITGDPPKMGDYPEATAVFDVDAIGLVNIVHALNHGRDIGGNGRTADRVPHRRRLNLARSTRDLEIRRFEEGAAAPFAITQPVSDPQLERFLVRIRHVKIPIIAGIWPLVSLKNAEFMNNEVPGVKVPEWILEKMRKAGSVDEQREVGLESSVAILERVRGMVEGVQISAPFGRAKTVTTLIRAASLPAVVT
jgi:homocysteine S-methyltransferase